jgi:hypothetical protein
MGTSAEAKATWFGLEEDMVNSACIGGMSVAMLKMKWSRGEKRTIRKSQDN